MLGGLFDAIAGAATRADQTFTTTSRNAAERRNDALDRGSMFAAGWLGVDAAAELRRSETRQESRERRAAGGLW